VDDQEAIARTILALGGPPLEQIAAFVRMGRAIDLKKGEPFEDFGATAHRLGFVHAGLLRYHVIDARGADVTKDFALAGSFCASFGSALRGAPAEVAISAVVDARLTVWPFARATALYAEHPGWERFGRKVAELLYLRKERRELDLLRLSAAERHESARRELGEAFAILPRHLLASYLGIAPESLSRLRKRPHRDLP
jgi:CRP-like cAMP-binding protein